MFSFSNHYIKRSEQHYASDYDYITKQLLLSVFATKDDLVPPMDGISPPDKKNLL